MAGYAAPRYLPAGDAALVVELGDEIDLDLNARVRALAHVLQERPPRGVLEVVPTYRSLLVSYDPGRAAFGGLVRAVQRLLPKASPRALPAPRRHELPVLYGGDHGPDLDFVAEHAGLTPAEVVARHSAPEYVVYMLGFTPGFLYLGDLPDELAVPRLATPRTALPAGAVGIGGRQTGVYSLPNSPGGWRWIGWTPVRLWDPTRTERPFLAAPGDRVRFVPSEGGESG